MGVLAVSALAILILLAVPPRYFRSNMASSPARHAAQALPSSPIIPNGSAVLANFAKLPLSFEPNYGQTDSRVRFVSRSQSTSVFVLPGEMVFAGQPLALKGLKRTGRSRISKPCRDGSSRHSAREIRWR